MPKQVATEKKLAHRSILQNVFSYYRMCSLITECVLLLQVATEKKLAHRSILLAKKKVLITECVLLLQNVFSYYRMCSLITGASLNLACKKEGASYLK